MTKTQLHQAKLQQVLKLAADLESNLRELQLLEPDYRVATEVKSIYNGVSLHLFRLEETYPPI